MAGSDHHSDGFIDALRLDHRDVQRILSDMDTVGDAFEGDRRREHERYLYRTPPGVLVTIEHPGGSGTTFRVMPRNLSSSGLGFLHGNFVYDGRPATVQLRRVDGRLSIVQGRVVRCTHVRGKVHEVGVRFDGEINLCDYLAAAERPAGSGAAPLTPRLDGTLLYIEDCVDDRELVRYFADEMGVEVTMTDDPLEGIELATATDVDLVLTAVDLPAMDGPALLAALRDAGYDGPVIAVETDHPDRRAAPSARYNEVLHKPFALTRLAQALSVYLPIAQSKADRPEEGPLASTRWYDEKMRPLITGFLNRLEQRTTDLQAALTAGPDACDWRRLLRELKGSAGGYGYPQISDAADEILSHVEDSNQWRAAHSQVQDLIKLCDRACMVARRPGHRA